MARGVESLRNVALIAALGGCTVGPSVHVPSAPPPVIARADNTTPSRARSILDSLDNVRTGAKGTHTVGLLTVATPLSVDSARDLAWLEVLRDTQLVTLVRAAVANNRERRAAEARVREYRARLGAARGDFFPQIIASGSASRYRSALGPTVQQFDDVQAIGELSWEVDFWGRVRRQTQVAGFDLSARQEDVRSITLLLVSDVAAAYLQVRELDASLRIADQTLASRGATLAIARRRFAQGVTSELDVRLFEAELAEPAARVAEFARQRVQVENQIALLIGAEPRAIPPGSPLAEIVQAVDVPDSLPGALLARRPDVLAADRTMRAAVARIGVAVANRLPTTRIGGRYGAEGPALGGGRDGMNEVYTLQVGVSMPLFTGGRLHAEERAARARADEARELYEQTVLTAMRESNDALAGVRFGRDQLVARATNVQALQQAFVIAETRYRNGVSSYLEVLDAQRQLFSAQLALVQAQRQYALSTVDLFRALGGGWDVTAR